VSPRHWAGGRWWPLRGAALPDLRGLPSLPTWPVVAGGVGLVLAVVLAVGVTPRWQADQARAEAAARRAALARPAAALRAPAPPLPDATIRLWQALPAADQAPQRIADLTRLARQHGVTIDGSRLGRTAAPPDASALPVQQLPVAMAAHGPYLAVRRFVAEALQHDDALLLERLRISRASAAAAEVAVDLQWALLQRAPSAGQLPP
jgi:hypothetical protein